MLGSGWYALISIAATTGAVLAIRPWATTMGLVDRPNARKPAFRAVPVTGGVAMFAGFLIAMLAYDGPGALASPALAGAAAFLAIGIVDDQLDLPPRLKLVGQAAAAATMLLLGQGMAGPGELLGAGPLHLPVLDAFTTLFFIVGIANAFNMLDGLDGLAGGAAWVILACLAVIAAVMGQDTALCRIAALLAAVSGFLLFNARHPYRRTAAIFMGDAGSLMLGGVIASLILDIVSTPASAGGALPPPAMPVLLWLVALPAIDTLALIVRRLLAGRSPMKGDRCHIHHVLLEAGCNVEQAVAVLVLVCAADAAVVLLAWWLQVAPGWMLLGLVAQLAGHALLVTHGVRAFAPVHRRPAGSTALADKAGQS